MGRSVLLSLLLIGLIVPAQADDASDRAALTARLAGWAAAFNARDAAGACDLFAADLIGTVPGATEQSRQTVCDRLSRVLENRSIDLHYSPAIKEIIVSGDLAVVRLFWTLTTQHGSERSTQVEAGMDVFRRQAGGQWSIIRFLAFPVGP